MRLTPKVVHQEREYEYNIEGLTKFDLQTLRESLANSKIHLGQFKGLVNEEKVHSIDKMLSSTQFPEAFLDMELSKEQVEDLSHVLNMALRTHGHSVTSGRLHQLLIKIGGA